MNSKKIVLSALAALSLTVNVGNAVTPKTFAIDATGSVLVHAGGLGFLSNLWHASGAIWNYSGTHSENAGIRDQAFTKLAYNVSMLVFNAYLIKPFFKAKKQPTHTILVSDKSSSAETIRLMQDALEKHPGARIVIKSYDNTPKNSITPPPAVVAAAATAQNIPSL
jgi:hypothetical protein